MKFSRIFILDGAGGVRPNVKVEVRLHGTTTRAQLYIGNDTSGPSKPNPLTTSDDGVITFFAPNGKYDLYLNPGTASEYHYDLVEIFDIFEMRDQMNESVWPSDALPAADSAAAYLITRIGSQMPVDARRVKMQDILRRAPNGTAATPAFSFQNDPSTGTFLTAEGALGWSVGGVERARIDANGCLGVGTAAPYGRLHVALGGAFSWGGGWNGNVAVFGNGGNVGAAVGISYDNTSGGRIGTIAPGAAWKLTSIGGDTVALCTDGFNVAVRVDKINTYFRDHILPMSDNQKNLGWVTDRFSTLYAGTGAINTSDAREKKWQRGLSAAEIAAGREIIAELGWYQWLAQIAEKGEDGARWHFGARAQTVWRIMAAHGLIAPLGPDGLPTTTACKCAFLCFDEWEEETEDRPTYSDTLLDADGNPAKSGVETVIKTAAGNRFGLRPDELWPFLIAVQETRIAALEAAA